MAESTIPANDRRARMFPALAATSIEALRSGDEEVIVVGGGNSAGQAATYLVTRSKHIHVLTWRHGDSGERERGPPCGMSSR